MTPPKWHEGRVIAFDVETTGVNPHTDRIVTAAVVHHAPGQRPRTISWVIDPQVPVPAGAAAVHGWTDEKLRAHLGTAKATRTINGATRPLTRDGALFEITAQLGTAIGAGVPVIGFNVAYDASILEAECRRWEVPTITDRPKGWAGVVDGLVIDKHYSRRKGSRKLVDQCTHHGVILSADGAHDAATDALAALRLIPRMVAAYVELGKRSLDWLHEQQVAWRVEQQKSLAAYFDRIGQSHDGCCGSWPVHGTCCAPAVAHA